MIYTEEIDKIKKQIMEKFKPVDIFLFGSYAKGLITKKSDIDICVIMDIKKEEKREMARRILIEVECESDLDVVVYTLEEWEKYKDDPSTFANLIKRTGVSIIDRYDKV
ncbi:MAG: nucleotidyltransferase domain-containing protein [Thermovenabulum sp.]|uniref:nucleotidyltransferase domain-containing protein n=1 Tax=Thermovenabulum sp. TaxID=3100335 RepID=UPI003C7B37CA